MEINMLSGAKSKLTFIAIGASLLATTAHAKTEAFFNAGDIESFSGIRTMLPIFTTDASSLNVDARLALSNRNIFNLSLGALWRQMGETAAYGIYLGADSKKSHTENQHKQAVLGVERLGALWDLRTVLYVPIDSEFKLNQKAARDELKTEFAKHQLQQRVIGYQPASYVLEESLPTAVFEVGRLIPSSTRLEMRGYLGAYMAKSAVMGTAAGGSVRLEAAPTDNLRVNFSAQNDKIFDVRLSLDVAWAFGRRAVNNGIRSPEARAADFFERSAAIFDTGIVPEDKRMVLLAGSSEIGKITTLDKIDSIAHIDNSKAAGGDGSFENPYNSIESCQASTAAYNCNSAKIIYVHHGASRILKDKQVAADQNAAKPYIGNFKLKDEQQLIGDGSQRGNFAKVSSGIEPVILSATDATGSSIIAAGNDSKISGVRLGWHFGLNSDKLAKQQVSAYQALPATAKMSDSAIQVAGKTNVEINDVNIVGYSPDVIGGGAFSKQSNFRNGIDISGNSQLAISKLIVQTALENAIKISASDQQKQQISINGANLVRNGRGIYIHANGDQIEQNISLRGYQHDKVLEMNILQSNLNEGVLIDSADITKTVRQIINVDNMHLVDNGGAGIYANFAKNAGGKLGSQLKLNEVYTLSNSGAGLVVQSGAGNTEINIKNSAFAGNIAGISNYDGQFNYYLDGSEVEAGNQRQNAKGLGLYFFNRDDAGAQALQTINISGSTTKISHHEKAQIYLDSKATGQSNQKLTISSDAAKGIATTKAKRTGAQKFAAIEGESIQPIAHFDGVDDGKYQNQEFAGEAANMVTVDTKNKSKSTEKNLGVLTE